MKVSTHHERIAKQVFHLDIADLRSAVEMKVRSHGHQWAKVPAGASERIEIEFDEDERGPIARMTRIFTHQEPAPPPEGAQ